MLDYQAYFNTVKWSIIIGTNSGYELSKQQEMPESKFAELYRTIADVHDRYTGQNGVVHRVESSHIH